MNISFSATYKLEKVDFEKRINQKVQVLLSGYQ